MVERKYDKKILIVNYKTDLWEEFSVFNCIDNGKKNYDIRKGNPFRNTLSERQQREDVRPILIVYAKGRQTDRWNEVPTKQHTIENI